MKIEKFFEILTGAANHANASVHISITPLTDVTVSVGDEDIGVDADDQEIKRPAVDKTVVNSKPVAQAPSAGTDMGAPTYLFEVGDPVRVRAISLCATIISISDRMAFIEWTNARGDLRSGWVFLSNLIFGHTDAQANENVPMSSATSPDNSAEAAPDHDDDYWHNFYAAEIVSLWRGREVIAPDGFLGRVMDVFLNETLTPRVVVGKPTGHRIFDLASVIVITR